MYSATDWSETSNWQDAWQPEDFNESEHKQTEQRYLRFNWTDKTGTTMVTNGVEARVITKNTANSK